MSLEFNRRSFLKYSAAAAVAVAGSSLLVGCGKDEYQKTGKIGSTLKLMGTFKMYDNSVAATAPSATNASGNDYGSFVCHINIKCRLGWHILFPNKVLQKIFCLCHNPTEQIRKPAFAFN